MTNGNGWVKPILVGVAIAVLAAVIIGAGSNTVANSLSLSRQEVKVSTIETSVADNTKKTEGIDVMASQINDIKQDVGKILDKMEE